MSALTANSMMVFAVEPDVNISLDSDTVVQGKEEIDAENLTDGEQISESDVEGKKNAEENNEAEDKKKTENKNGVDYKDLDELEIAGDKEEENEEGILDLESIEAVYTDNIEWVDSEEKVNVKSFGAIGDGISDDTLAIKNAMLAADGRELYFPQGTYMVSDITCTVNNLILSSDEAAVIKKLNAVKEPMLTFYDCQKADIEGITFDAGRAEFGDDYDTACIYFRGEASNIFIAHCNFRNCSREATAFLGKASNVYIANNYYEKTSALVWLKGSYLDGLTFENNEAHDGRINGVELIANDTAYITHAVIRNNKFYNFGGNIVQCKNVADVEITDNYIEGAKNVIYYVKSNDEFVVDKCVIKGNSGSSNELIHIDGISVDDIKYEYVELADNSFELTRGLKVENASVINMSKEKYTIAPEGKINIYKSDAFTCNGIEVNGDSNEREYLYIKTVKSIDIENSNFSSARPVFYLSGIGSNAIKMKSVHGNFKGVSRLQLTNESIYNSVIDCHNNTEQLIDLTVTNGTLKLPVVDEKYVISAPNASISNIQGYAFEGRIIELFSDSSFIIKKGTNIEIDSDTFIDANMPIRLIYQNGTWQMVGETGVIMSQPADCECQAGDEAEFIVDVAGKKASFQWYKSIDNGANWTKTFFEGSKTNRIVVPVQNYMNNYLFRCQITFSNDDMIISDAGKIVIRKSVLEIIKQPETFCDTEAENAVFSVEAIGDSVKYQWYKSIDSGVTWTKTFYTGFTTNEVSIPLQKYMNHYLFKCVLTDKYGNECQSDPGEIIFRGCEISEQPQDTSCKAGGIATFEIEVSGEPKSYQWYKSTDGGKNWTKTYYDGARTPKLRIEAAKYMNGYLFKCILTDFDCNEIESDPAKVYIIEGLKVVKQPQNCICNDGETAAFSTEAIGVGKIAYVWERSKDNGKTWEIVPYGATRYKQTLEFPVYNFIRDYLIRCKVSDDTESIYTEIVKLKSPVRITKQPSNTISDYDKDIEFMLEAEGDDLAFQWEYSDDGEEWISIPDAISCNYETTFFSDIEVRRYRCLVQDCAGYSVYSSEVKGIKDEHRTFKLFADTDFTYVDDRYEHTELIKTNDVIDKAKFISESNSTSASMSILTDIDAGTEDVLLIYFAAKASDKCAKIKININKSFSGQYPVETEWEDYYFPFSVSDGSLDLRITLLTEYQDIEIRNLIILNYGNVNPAKVKSGIYMQDAKIDRYYLGDSIGNKAISLKAVDGYLYALNDGRLTIYNEDNVNESNAVSRLEGLGRVRDMEILPGRDILAVSSRENGAFFVDISDKKEPRIISNYSTLEMATGIDAFDNYVCICDRYHGVEILDVSNVEEPVFCSQIKNGDELYECKFSDGYLYIGAWGQKKVYVYSLNNIYNPVLQSIIYTDGWTAGLEVKNNILYIATGGKSSDKALVALDPGFGMGNGLEIYDITNPSNPVWLSTSKIDGKYQDAGYDHWKVAVSGNIAVLCSVYNGVYTFDVSDPSAPIRKNHVVVSIPKGTKGYYFNSNKADVVYPYIGTEEIWAPIMGIAITDGRLYFSAVDHGLFSLSDACFVADTYVGNAYDFENDSIEHPLYSNNLNPYSYKISSFKDDSYPAYAIQGHEDRLYVACGNKGISVFDKQSMEVISNYDGIGNILDLKIKDDILYAAASSGGMKVFQICDEGLVKKGECNVSGSSVSFSQLVYLAKSEAVVAQIGWGNYAIIDVSDIANPIVNQTVSTGKLYYRNISTLASADEEYVLISSSSQYDIYKADKTGLNRIFTSNKAFLGEAAGSAVYGHRIFYITQKGFGYFDMDRMEEKDFENINVHSIPEIKLDGKVVIGNNLMVVNNPTTGVVSIIDITNLDEPVLVNSIKFNSNPDICYIEDGKIYIPARHGGIIVLERN